jgi:D-glycero-D-manno-heptose 1,7-bisphosphate phosphatase
MKAAVFFDRDGVLNEVRLIDGSGIAPWSVDQFKLMPDARDAVRRVVDAGFLAIVVTNQPEITTGELKREELERIHSVLKREVPVHAIYYCPHHKSNGCGCHKPMPGLLDQAKRDWDIDFSKSFLIGDRWRDIGAANAAGCTGILLERSYSGDCTGPCAPAHRARTLGEAVDWVLQRRTAV